MSSLPIPAAAIAQHTVILGKGAASANDRLQIERALAALTAAGTLRISSAEELPFWVILRSWHRIQVQDCGCHVFVGNNGNYYGHRRIEYGGRPFYVHRIAYALRYGPIPNDRVVRHRCDNGPCVNAEHLETGTQLENIADMYARGRNVNPPVLRGMDNPRSVLTDRQVASLRRAAGTPGANQRAIAKRFGVSQSTVWRLVHGHVRRADHV